MTSLKPSLRDKVDKLSQQMTDYIDKELNKYDSEIDKALKYAANEVQSLSVKKDWTLKDRVELGRELDTILEIFTQKNLAFSQNFPEQIKIIDDIFKGLGIPPGDPLKDLVKATQQQTLSGQEAINAIVKGHLAELITDSYVIETPKAKMFLEIQQALIGGTDIRGRSMSSYAKTFAQDAVMDFNRKANTIKGQDAGLTDWLYYGDVIKDSRPFCVQHAGEILSDEDIQKIQTQLDTVGWTGAKPGNFYIVAGGYGCRHHLQAIKAEWLENL